MRRSFQKARTRRSSAGKSSSAGTEVNRGTGGDMGACRSTGWGAMGILSSILGPREAGGVWDASDDRQGHGCRRERGASPTPALPAGGVAQPAGGEGGAPGGALARLLGVLRADAARLLHHRAGRLVLHDRGGRLEAHGAELLLRLLRVPGRGALLL